MINNLPVNFENSFITNKITNVVKVIIDKKHEDLLANIDEEQLLIDMYVFKLYNFEYAELLDIIDDIKFSEPQYNSLKLL
jgi:hypothetical protein